MNGEFGNRNNKYVHFLILGMQKYSRQELTCPIQMLPDTYCHVVWLVVTFLICKVGIPWVP